MDKKTKQNCDWIVIGCVNNANPKKGERFYLRLFLNHVRGPTSFEDLLTIDGIHYLSFKM